MQPLAYIPSPSQGVWHLGPIPIRAYAVMIILGIVVAVWLGERRWAAKGGTPGVVIDVAVWAVPFGLVGGRLYHVLTDYQRYFGAGGDPLRSLEIWRGGLGIWGSIALGAVGAIIGCRRRGISTLALADAVAPGIVLAQAIGRWGNYWNQELYGRPLDAFWAIKIDENHRPVLDGGPALDPKYADVATYHPTFLYEFLWCIGVAVLVIWAERRYKLTHGRVFALYVAAYTVGRGWIEALRIDEAHHVLGLRLNDWTSIVLLLGAVGYMYWARDRTEPLNVVVPSAETASGGPDGDAPAEAEPEAGAEAETEAGTEAETEASGESEDAVDLTKEPEPETAEAADDSASEAPGTDGSAETDDPGDETAAASGKDEDDESESAEPADAKADAEAEAAAEPEKAEKAEPVRDGK